MGTDLVVLQYHQVRPRGFPGGKNAILAER